TSLRHVMPLRVNGDLDYQRIIDTAKLPASCQKLVMQFVEKTRLWRNEKVDVASELISHFQDGLEQGQSAAQLVEQFGDPLLAAKLIRITKKRNRSYLWHTMRYASIGLACFAVVYGASL